MKTLQNYKTQYDALDKKNNLSGDAALKAVKQDGDTLQYVQPDMFDNNDVIELNGIKYKRCSP